MAAKTKSERIADLVKQFGRTTRRPPKPGQPAFTGKAKSDIKTPEQERNRAIGTGRIRRGESVAFKAGKERKSRTRVGETAAERVAREARERRNK